MKIIPSDHLFSELVSLPTLETDTRKVHLYPWLLKKVENGQQYWIQNETKRVDIVAK